jgi:hypothetical protein
MLEPIVQIALVVAGLYLLAGAVFAVVFHRRGIAKMDHSADGATWGFRVLVTPGIISLWPLLLKRWREGDGVSWLGSQVRPVSPERLRRRHGLLIVLVLLIVLALAIPALVLRPGEPVQSGLPHELIRAGH